MTIIPYLEVSATSIVAILSIVLSKNIPELKWIKIYCVVNGIADIIGFILAYNRIINIPLVYLTLWIEFFVLVQYFCIVSPKIGNQAKLSLLAIIYITFLGILIFFESLAKFYPYSQIFEGVLIFLLCLIYFYEQLKSPKVPFIYEEPDFWFVSAFLIYYGSTWVMLLSLQYFDLGPKMFIYFWDWQNILSILKNVAITTGFICSKRN